MDVDGHRAMLGYLERVNAAATARHLPAGARTRLLAQVRARVEAESAAAGGSAEAVAAVLARLGAPHALVDGLPPASPPPSVPPSVRAHPPGGGWRPRALPPAAPSGRLPRPPASRSVRWYSGRFRPGIGTRELAAIAVLGIGWLFFPGLNAVAGGALVLAARGFTAWEKLATAGALVVGTAVPMLVTAATRGITLIELPTAVFGSGEGLVLTGFLTAVFLGYRVRRHT